jgi:drug/metabolite transporter (DMT)-like permease
MAICPSILAYIFWNRGVAELGAPKAGLFIHLMPLFGIVLSAIFLGEAIRSYHFVGMALIFGGIYLAVVADALKRIQKTT